MIAWALSYLLQSRASAVQTRLLELSREDVDGGGSETSSVLREQVAALTRMRDADKKVMDALKRHISMKWVSVCLTSAVMTSCDACLPDC